MRLLLLLTLLLTGCSKGPQSDLPSISQARSLAAEWALINELAANGRLTHVYIATMHKQLREQLQTAASSLRQPDSRYGEEIHAVLSQPDDAPPDELRVHVDQLKQIEDALESA